MEDQEEDVLEDGRHSRADSNVEEVVGLLLTPTVSIVSLFLGHRGHAVSDVCDGKTLPLNRMKDISAITFCLEEKSPGGSTRLRFLAFNAESTQC